MNKLLTKLMGNAQINIAADFQEQGRLGAGQVLALRKPRGRKIVCTEGTLWVTNEGEYNDHLLGPSQSIALPAEGKTVIGGLDGSSYRFASL